MPIKLKKLPALKGRKFVKLLSTLIKKKFKDGMSVPFMIILNHTFQDLGEKKSQKMPLFLIGNPDSSWKNYHKEDAGNNKKQKKFMVAGQVRRSGDTLILDIDNSKGLNKLPNKSKQYVNALLRKINKNLKVTTVGDSGGEVNAKLQKGKAEEIADETKEYSKEAMRDMKSSNEDSAYKEGLKKDAAALSEAIKNLRKMMDSSLKTVAKNIKKGATSGKDLKAVKATNEAFEKFLELHQNAAEPIQKKFSAAYNKLTGQKADLYKLALSAKKRKKSLAQRMADSFYQLSEKRIATPDEIKTFNAIIKDTIKNNKKGKNKVDQALLLRATSYVLKRVGPDNYKTDYTEQVLEKMAA